MSQEQTSVKCFHCGEYTLHARPRTNHVLHLLVTLFTCGLWVLVWIVIHGRNGRADWTCQKCGWSTPYELSFAEKLADVMFYVITLAVLLAIAYSVVKEMGSVSP